ncbi:MAG: lipoprotein [Pseudomonadota bacterium]
MRFCWAQYAFGAMVIVLGLLAMLSGCGAKGDLFLPPEQAREASAEPAPETTENNSQGQ